MTADDAGDASVDGLERLQSLAPDPWRAERVRARCRTQIGRMRQPASGIAVATGFASRAVAPVVLGFCALYVATLVTIILRLGALR